MIKKIDRKDYNSLNKWKIEQIIMYWVYRRF